MKHILLIELDLLYFVFFRLSKLAGRYNRDLTLDEREKCKKETIAFDGDNCVSKALDFCLKLKGEERRVKNKIVEYNFQLHAHNGNGFDTWIFLINLDCDKHIVNLIKNGRSIIELKVFNGYIEKNKKQIPQNLHLRCGMIHLIYSLKKLGKTKGIKLQKELLKTEMNHDEVDGKNYKDEINELPYSSLPYVKNDVLCTAFSYARYFKAMEEKTGFSMKDCLSLPRLGLKYFKSLRTEEDEPMYIYNDKYMRWFVRQAAYGGQVCAFNQYYKSKSCQDILKIISKELCVKGNDCDFKEAYMEYKNKHFEIFEKEYEDQSIDFRNENVEKYINEKLSNLRLHKIIKRTELIHLLWDFDAVSLYPSAMWDPKSIYPKTETGYAFKREMNDERVENFNNQTFSQGSAILKIKYFNPKNLIVQHLPVKEKEKKIEI